ncbi:uncharacterized protein LOC117648354 [Thrips palmi]|uniref:Uncharacterized protein LOC117648354 n=1 Tax=Thrips palmi TaxID=161013 RepID=A0A6P8Z8T0_THRPL|nr:uncharacterized protein LOC117648354 [Thrips palmi]
MEDFPSEISAVEALVYYLHHSLKESGSKWSVDSRNEMCRLTLLTDNENVAVERAVVWSPNEGTKIFFNNNQLPKDNFILTMPQPDQSKISDLAQYLQILTTVVESVKLCEGVTTYTDSWNAAEELGMGQIDKCSSQSPRYRSKDCTLVYMEAKRCEACECNRLSFKQKKWRDDRAEESDLSKINNRYLLRKALLAKTKSLAKEKKIAGKTIRYYKKKVRQMIKSESIVVDQHLSKDFFDVMKQNVTKMTPIQKLFWSEQMKAISKQSNPRTMRWNPMMIKIALHLQSLSPTAYEYLRESGLLQLPSQRRLYDFSHFTQAKEGIQQAVIDLLSEKLEKVITEDYQRYFNLLFDEMSIQSGLVVTKSGDIVGFVNLSEIEQSVADLENQLAGEGEIKKQEAKKVLVFMLQGVSLDVHEVVAIFPTTELSAEQLYTRAWDVIFNLESRNIKILTLIGDGAGCNKKFFKMHAKYDHSEEFVYSTRNIACGEDRPIFFMIDPPHLLKTIRNCFSNSHGHYNTRAMWKDGEVISWAALEALLNASIKDKFKKHKLTWAHVKLTAFTRMNVKYATQTMSNSASLSLSDYKDDERFDGLVTSQLLMFLKEVNKFFDCLNGSHDPDGKRNKSNKNLLPYKSVNDERLTTTLKKEVLKFFQDWQKSVENREGEFTAEDREKMTISSQSYESLHITIFGFCGAVKFLLDCGAPSIDAKKFNQDKLEQYFGILRMCGGASNNPTLQGVLQKSLALTVQKGAALPGKKGNTRGTRQLVIDEEPLPCRPRK